MAQEDDIKTGKIALVGTVGTLIVLIIVLALQVAYYHAVASQFQDKEINALLVESQTALSQQQAKLAQCQWIDREHGVVSIPIDRAMDLVVRQGGSSHGKR